MSSNEEWPTEETTVVRHPVDPATPVSPPPGAPGPPPRRGPDDAIGWGFLIGILIALVVGGIVAAVLLTRGHHHHQAGVTRTVVVTRGGTTSTVTVTRPGATSPGTTPGTPTTAPSPAPTAPATPPKASVPDVGSSRVQSAVDDLARAGLLVTLAYVPSSSEFGIVVAQSPSAGSSAPAGSHVTLNLSAGKGASESAVPDVTGRTIPQAVSEVKRAGLRLIFVRKHVTDRSQAGTVLDQTPTPGTKLPRNAEVLVYMGAAA